MNVKPLALLLLAGVAAAQDVATPATEMKQVQDEAAAPTEMKQVDDTAAKPKAPAKPRPAMMAPLAKSTTLLGLALAGQRLVAVGQRGHILLSDDGKDWRQVEVPVNAMLNRVRFRNEKAGWAVGHDATILITKDAGETWAVQHYDPEGKALYDVLFLDDRRLIAVGAYGTYFASADDGADWTLQSFPLTELGQHFNGATRLADGTLLLAGEKGLIARSKDNAATWELLDSPYTGSFFGVLPAGEHGALVFGLRGNIYVAGNVGTCPTLDPAQYDPYTRETVSDPAALAKLGWQPLTRPTTEGLFGGTADGAQAVLVGVNGVVVRVDAAQMSAVLAPAKAPETLNDVIKRGDRWYAVGRRGIQDLGTLGRTGTGGAAGGEH